MNVAVVWRVQRFVESCKVGELCKARAFSTAAGRVTGARLPECDWKLRQARALPVGGAQIRFDNARWGACRVSGEPRGLQSQNPSKGTRWNLPKRATALTSSMALACFFRMLFSFSVNLQPDPAPVVAAETTAGKPRPMAFQVLVGGWLGNGLEVSV